MTTDDSTVQLESLIRHSSDIITALDSDRTIQYHSPATDRVLGYGENGLVGEDLLESVHPDDRATVLDAFRDLGEDRTTSVQFRFRHTDGLWVPLEVAISKPADPDAANYVLNAREIANRERFETDEERITDRMSDGFFALDEKWRVTRLNGTAASLLDRDSEGLLGAVFWEAFHEAVEAGDSVAFEAYYEPLVTTFEVRAYPAEGSLSVYFRDVSEG